ncbi:MAG: hypothetical protein HDT30_03600 [Clostridiales bacterium]|nr:hypothetical protein [Clostridiales bacterium]
MILFKKKYKYIFCILPIILLFRYELVFFLDGYYIEDTVGEVFLSHLFGGSFQMEKLNFTQSVFGLFPLIYFSILFADYIVQDFFANGEYIFTRYTSRASWYKKKLLGTAAYSIIGVFLTLLLYVYCGIRESGYPITSKDITLILCTYIMLLLFLYFGTICLNIFVMYQGTTIGFVIYYSGLAISTIAALMIQKLPNKNIAQILHCINPMSNIFVSWNFSDIYVLWGIGYYIILCILISVLLWKIIKKREIGINVRVET